VEKLKIKRDPARNPLFDVALSVQNYGEASRTINRRIPLENPELEIGAFDWSPGTTKFDLTLYVIENAGKLNLSIKYSTKPPEMKWKPKWQKSGDGYWDWKKPPSG
jgi:hypothetical protein